MSISEELNDSSKRAPLPVWITSLAVTAVVGLLTYVFGQFQDTIKDLRNRVDIMDKRIYGCESGVAREQDQLDERKKDIDRLQDQINRLRSRWNN